jgi:hypothetical protein
LIEASRKSRFEKCAWWYHGLALKPVAMNGGMSGTICEVREEMKIYCESTDDVKT